VFNFNDPNSIISLVKLSPFNTFPSLLTGPKRNEYGFYCILVSKSPPQKISSGTQTHSISTKQIVPKYRGIFTFNMLTTKPKKKGPLGRPRYGRENNI
jgi:hypothetical protein